MWRNRVILSICSVVIVLLVLSGCTKKPAATTAPPTTAKATAQTTLASPAPTQTTATQVGTTQASTTKPAATTPSTPAAKVKLTILTGAEGSAQRTWAIAMSNIINKYSTKVQLTAEISPGTNETPGILQAGKAHLAVSGQPGTYDAGNGVGTYAGKPATDVRLMAAWGPTFYLMFTKNPNVNNVQDLKGKKVATGPATAGASVLFKALFEKHLPELGVKPVNYGSAGDLVDAVRDGLAEVGIYGVGQPWAPLYELATTQKIKIIGMAEVFETVLKEQPYREIVNLPANTYPGQTTVVKSFGSSSGAMVRADVPDELVTDMLTILEAHYDEMLVAAPAAISFLDPNALDKAGMRLHPATAKWLEHLKK